MLRRTAAVLVVLAACALGAASPAQAAGPSSITVGPVTLGNPGCC